METNIIILREALYLSVWSIPTAELAKKYGKNEAAFKKVCIEHNIPLPRNEYWEMKLSGLNPPRTPLPGNYKGETIIRFTLPEKKKKGLQKSFAKETEKVAPAQDNRLPAREDSRVSAARKTLKAIETRSPYQMVHTKNNQLEIQVYPDGIDLACRFMNEFIAALHIKGYSMFIKDEKTYLKIGEQPLPVLLREKGKRIEIKKKDKHDFRTTDYVSSGVFIFRVALDDNKEWELGDGTLADEAANLIIKLKKYSVEIDKKVRENEWREKKETEQKQIKREHDIKVQNELSQLKRLGREAKRKELSQKIREYLNEIEKKATEGGWSLSPEKEEWLKRARAIVDWFDPLVAASNELLDGIDPDAILKQLEEKQSGQSNFDWMTFFVLVGYRRYR